MEPRRRQPQTQDRKRASEQPLVKRSTSCDELLHNEISAHHPQFSIILHPFMRFFGIPCSLLCFLLFICQTSALAARRADSNNEADTNPYTNYNTSGCTHCSPCTNALLEEIVPGATDGSSRAHNLSSSSAHRNHTTYSSNSADANTHSKLPRLPGHPSTCPCSLSCGMAKDLQSLDPLPLRGPLSPVSSTPRAYTYPLDQQDFSHTLGILPSASMSGVGAGVAASFGRDRITFVSPKTGPPSKN